MADIERYMFTFKDRDCPRIEFSISTTLELAEDNRDVRARWNQEVGPVVRVSLPLPEPAGGEE